VIGKFT